MDNTRPATLLSLIDQCWSQDPSGRPAFDQILCHLDHLAKQLDADPLLPPLFPDTPEHEQFRAVVESQLLELESAVETPRHRGWHALSGD